MNCPHADHNAIRDTPQPTHAALRHGKLFICKCPFQEFKNLKLKAAGVAFVLLFIGSVAATALSVISTDIRRWLGLSP